MYWVRSPSGAEVGRGGGPSQSLVGLKVGLLGGDSGWKGAKLSGVWLVMQGC